MPSAMPAHHPPSCLRVGVVEGGGEGLLCWSRLTNMTKDVYCNTFLKDKCRVPLHPSLRTPDKPNTKAHNSALKLSKKAAKITKFFGWFFWFYGRIWQVVIWMALSGSMVGSDRWFYEWFCLVIWQDLAGGSLDSSVSVWFYGRIGQVVLWMALSGSMVGSGRWFY